MAHTGKNLIDLSAEEDEEDNVEDKEEAGIAKVLPFNEKELDECGLETSENARNFTSPSPHVANSIDLKLLAKA